MGAPAAGNSRGFVNEGFAGVPDSANVKTIKVMSKKKMAQAQGVADCMLQLARLASHRAACDSPERGLSSVRQCRPYLGACAGSMPCPCDSRL